MPADATIAMQLMPQTYGAPHTGPPLAVETRRHLGALAPRMGGTSGARQVAVRAPELRTESASQPTHLGLSDPVGAGLFAADVVHPVAPSACEVHANRETEHDTDACTDGADGRSDCGQT